MQTNHSRSRVAGFRNSSEGVAEGEHDEGQSKGMEQGLDLYEVSEAVENAGVSSG